MQEIIILAGPNGAGKSSFAEQFLRDAEGISFVNADELARSLPDRPQQVREVAAARLMLRQLDALARAKDDFMFETTLSSLGYGRRILDWRRAGYYALFICGFQAWMHRSGALHDAWREADMEYQRVLFVAASHAASPAFSNTRTSWMSGTFMIVLKASL